MNSTQQLTTFYLGRDQFAIEVLKVQEVTGPSKMMKIPLAPGFVTGLINLRGQIATAIGLQELLGMKTPESDSRMSVVCKVDGNLISLLVDSIGDVIEVEQQQFETAPETLPQGFRKFIKGVYKTESDLLSVLDLEQLSKELSNQKSSLKGEINE